VLNPNPKLWERLYPHRPLVTEREHGVGEHGSGHAATGHDDAHDTAPAAAGH
jgi:hypothetical protein